MNDPSSIASDPNRTQLGAAPSADPNKTILGTAPTVNATITIKPVQCPVCKTFNPAGMMFCTECGLIFDRALPNDAFGAPAVQLPVLVEQSGREHPIRPGENIVGREGDVQIVDGRVSRKHARIDSHDDVLEVEDLGSTNGTLLNGDKVERGHKKILAAGDTLSFGGVELGLSLPGGQKGGATQSVPSRKTAAVAAPPSLEPAAAFLEGEHAEYPLRAGVNSFGRKAGNDVQIVDPYVSGSHGEIDVAEDGVYLTDIGSTNGTMLNDAKLAPNMRTLITPDDVIRLGSLEFHVRVA